MTGRALWAVLVMLLVACALSLVTSQQRARNTFIDLERAQTRERDLSAEGDRLRIELGRLSQPAAIESAARHQGLRPLEPAQTVLLPVKMSGAAASTTEAKP